MLTVKVWRLPTNLEEEQLREIHKALVAAAVAVPEVDVRTEADMIAIFPPDLMTYGLGDDILIEMSLSPSFHHKPTSEGTLAQGLGGAIRRFFPRATIRLCPIQHTGEYNL